MNIQATAKSQSARYFTCSVHQSCTHMSKLEKQVWLRTYLAYAGTGPYHDHHRLAICRCYRTQQVPTKHLMCAGTTETHLPCPVFDEAPG